MQSDRTLGKRSALGLSFSRVCEGRRSVLSALDGAVPSVRGTAYCTSPIPRDACRPPYPPQLCDSKVILWFQTVVEMTSMSDPFLPLQQKPGMVPPPPGEESQTVILPPGWHSYLSPQGRRYYVNTTTNGESRSGRAFSNPPPPTCLPLPGLLFSLPFHPLVWGFFLLNLTQGKVT